MTSRGFFRIISLVLLLFLFPSPILSNDSGRLHLDLYLVKKDMFELIVLDIPTVKHYIWDNSCTIYRICIYVYPSLGIFQLPFLFNEIHICTVNIIDCLTSESIFRHIAAEFPSFSHIKSKTPQKSKNEFLIDTTRMRF